MSDLKVYRVDDGGESVWCITDDPEKARAISRDQVEEREDFDRNHKLRFERE